MSRKPSRSFDATRSEILKDPESAAIYLEECLADGDMDLFTEALQNVTKAKVPNPAQ